ncbi:hypothetical protein JXA85_08580 [Candidatus Woesearchaeota archaeon]|nr:hypothetical protein [Candidatus Woesearchaeota archaeon]
MSTASKPRHTYFGSMLELQDKVVSAVAKALSENPDSIEEILGKNYSNGTDEQVKRIYSTLVNSDDAQKVQTEQKSALEEVLDIDEEADATFIARRGEDAELVFSEQLNNPLEQRKDFDKEKYPLASGLAVKLTDYLNWKTKKLKRAYASLREKQKEYLAEFDLTKLQKYEQKDLARDLNVSTSTISRMLKNRYIEVKNSLGKKKLFLANDFIVMTWQVKKYAFFPSWNKMLNEEMKGKKAYTDAEFAAASGKSLSRRVIAKYRDILGIPKSSKRKEEYQMGRTEPYRVKLRSPV